MCCSNISEFSVKCLHLWIGSKLDRLAVALLCSNINYPVNMEGQPFSIYRSERRAKFRAEVQEWSGAWRVYQLSVRRGNIIDVRGTSDVL